MGALKEVEARGGQARLDNVALDDCEVLSVEGGSFALSVEAQQLACYLSDGRLLVSRSHRTDPRVMAYRARVERLGRVVHPIYVELGVIQAMYAAARTHQEGKNGASSYTGTAMQSYAMNLFARAAQRSASDIHIRVSEGRSTQIMFRVLGDLEMIEEQVPSYGTAICSTVYQAMTDQSDATFVVGQPQDGRISNTKFIPSNVSGIRVATTPQVSGHVMVLRMLYKSSSQSLDLGRLGFSVAHQEAFARLRRRPTGIIINSGPTGAGKSTTLQCALTAVLKETGGRKHIITVEDPPEYPIPGAVQTPVVSTGGEEGRSAAFQSAIRAAMRLDPDVIMIGEMRDGPSARLAVAAAMTGHQVWTTLHANYAIDIADRMIDIGVPIERLTNPSVVSGLVAQRLVKLLCSHCNVAMASAGAGPHHSDEGLRRMRDYFGADGAHVRLRGGGCVHCANSGYSARTVLAEVIETDAKFLGFVREGDREGALRYWQECGGLTIAQHARAKVFAGTVDPFDAEEEILWT